MQEYGKVDYVPCGRGRGGEGVILRRRGCGWNRRPGRGNVDGRLELLPVLLLLLGLLLVVGTCAVPATSAPVEHPPRERYHHGICDENQTFLSFLSYDYSSSYNYSSFPSRARDFIKLTDGIMRQ